jgi:hypothetical protein
MNERTGRAVLWVWLGTAALLGYWFAWVAVSALFHVSADAGGNVVLLGSNADHAVYPFTYVAVGIAFIGLSYFVFDQERGRRDAPFLGPLVAYVGCVGMINLYEQIFLIGLYSSSRSTYWLVQDWGTPPSAFFSAIGIFWVFASAPWWHRRNLSLAVPLLLAYAVSMGLWMAGGFPPVESGLGRVYALNTISRVTSELVPVALATPPRITSRIYSRLPALSKLAGPLGKV